jgi:hypothetical protein
MPQALSDIIAEGHSSNARAFQTVTAQVIVASNAAHPKPAGVLGAFFRVVGGGGGGGSGARGDASQSRPGGGGGAGGLVTETGFIPASMIASTLNITIGASSAGGAARTTNDQTTGLAGTAGNATSVVINTNFTISAAGGANGEGATINAGGVAGTSKGVDLFNQPWGTSFIVSSQCQFPNPAGGTGGNGAAGVASTGGGLGGGGGGGGAGLPTAGTSAAGGAGTLGAMFAFAQQATSAANGGSAGAAGGSPSNLTNGFFGGGGGGGSSSSTAASGAGGNGAQPGGGGGGGAASRNGFNSGGGGAGGAGAVIIYWVS